MYKERTIVTNPEIPAGNINNTEIIKNRIK